MLVVFLHVLIQLIAAIHNKLHVFDLIDCSRAASGRVAAGTQRLLPDHAARSRRLHGPDDAVA